MKKMLTVLVLLALASNAFAQNDHYISIYADEAGSLCQMDTPNLYQNYLVYVLGTIDSGITGVSAVEFRLDGGPTADQAIITPNWNTDLVIGDPATGIALAFPVFLEPPLVLLGTINYFLILAFENDLTMTVDIAEGMTQITVVDQDYIEHGAMGCTFTFNCTGECLCCVVATENSSWGAIKALY